MGDGNQCVEKRLQQGFSDDYEKSGGHDAVAAKEVSRWNGWNG